MVEHGPAQHVGQEDIQRDSRGMELASQSKGFRTAQGDENLESLIARQIAKHAGIVRIVFDDQQDRIVGLQIVAIVRDLLGRMFGDDDAGQLKRHRRRGDVSTRRRELRWPDGPT